jgi:chromosome segregation ATPase
MKNLKTLIRQIIIETIEEIKIEDSNLESKIKEFANLSDQIDSISNELKKLKSQYSSLENILTPLLEELDDTQDKALEIEGILVTIKKRGFERTSYAYKEAFEWLVERVNPTMKKIVEEALEKTKKTSKIATAIGVQKIIPENKIIDSIKKYWNLFLNKIKLYNNQLGGYIDDIKKDIK